MFSPHRAIKSTKRKSYCPGYMLTTRVIIHFSNDHKSLLSRRTSEPMSNMPQEDWLPIHLDKKGLS